MEKILIAAVSENGVIGKEGQIPWKISADMKRFKELTTGHPVIMGRKTYFSIPQKFRPLQERENLVLTSQSPKEEGIYVCHSLEEALGTAEEFGTGRVYIAGGERVYNDTIEIADKLEITHVGKSCDGDVFFPKIREDKWREMSREAHETSNGLKYDFVSYSRK